MTTGFAPEAFRLRFKPDVTKNARSWWMFWLPYVVQTCFCFVSNANNSAANKKGPQIPNKYPVSAVYIDWEFSKLIAENWSMSFKKIFLRLKLSMTNSFLRLAAFQVLHLLIRLLIQNSCQCIKTELNRFMTSRNSYNKNKLEREEK